ncbi:MAG: hypothetical protein HUK24_09540, partial [Sphaerochaetaceae bacterium]|nr:hypothetical protein [Sphaerochaetaceae bacterium]
MKKKYIFLSVILAFMLTFSAYASSLQDLIDCAMENSPKITEIKISKQNSDISTMLSELEDQTTLKVDGSIVQNKLDENSNTAANMSFTASIPKDDDLSINAGVSVSGNVYWFNSPTRSSLISMTPNAGLTKSIDISSY